MDRIVRVNGIRKYLLLAALLLAGTLTAGAQNLYVIHNGGNYLSHNASTGAVNTTRVTAFDPTTCFWIISGSNLRPVNGSGAVLGDLYLRPRDGNYSYSLNTSTSTNYTGWSGGLSNGGQPYYDAILDRYLRLNGTTWEVSTTNNTNGTLRLVEKLTVESTSTNPTINGADMLTATGNSTYTATGAVYRAGGYTNYRFNNADHYFSGNTAITPANATLTYAWSLEDNAYATVNNSGVVTVSSLPEYDITLTLTVTATATGGTPAAPAGTTLTASKTITIQGTKPSAPIISVSGNTVTLSTDATGSTSIRYTLNGTDPTPSTGTVYSSAIDLSTSANSPITIKAITVRNGNASDVTEQTVTLTLPAPTITINGAAQTATISSSVAGATIYYTTDGTTPTTSSSQYTTTLTGLAYMTNVKAIAVKDGWNNSPEASGIVTIPSGVSGGVVTLFDYEPHSWSYYSDPDCPIRSLNPADVKITYYGNGTNNISTTNGATPGNNSWTQSASTVAVGVNESENTFVYYKTLERTDGSTTTDPLPSGRCKYTTIPNPFSVRPTYQYANGDLNKYCGFYAWRVVSVTGGSIYNSANNAVIATTSTTRSNHVVINAETDIYFAPTSEYGMEVELEALWARAYVKTGNANTLDANNTLVTNLTGGTYERNFFVITEGNTDNAINLTQNPVTISCRYPDGTSGGSLTSRIQNSFTCNADTKFEYVVFRGGANNYCQTITANNNKLIFGRGVTGYNSGICANNVRGMGGSTATALNYTIRLESGVFTYVSFIAGIAGGTGVTMTLSGTNNKVTGVLGSDYDRAIEKSTANYDYTTAPLKVTQSMSLGATPDLSNQTESEFFNATVKSGYFGSDNSVGDGAAARSFYIGIANTYNIGKRNITIEGGKFNLSIAGGIDEGNTSDDAVIIRMKGGTVAGSIYGAAAHAAATGGRKFIFTGGTVNGWIAGGCNGTETTGGKLTGKTFIYFGGNAQCTSNGSNTTIGPGNATGGNIFGAGSGNASAGANATVGEVDQSTIVIADECMVERGVYGGGNYGYVAGTGATNKSDIFVLGGDVKGSVFGGANMQKGNIVNITMKDGLVEGGIYGGSNTRGDISGSVTMQINGGQVGVDDNHRANIHGGGYGQSTSVNGNVSLSLGTCNALSGVTVYGDVYGGSALGAVNTNANNTTNVSLYKGTIYGGLYGGALGQTNPTSIAAPVRGAVTVNVYGGSVLCSSNDPQGVAGTGSVFGCNNVNGTPGSTVNVHIYNTDQPLSGYALHAVYGGGNKSAYTGIPVVTIHGCDNSIEYVYGGGNATDVRGTDVTIWGGTIGNAFAGGNGAGDGNPGANITADSARLVIHGGTIGAAFGGSNERGTINGGIRVTVKAATESGSDPCSGRVYEGCDMDIAELYGGGNRATIQSSTGAWHTPLMQLDCSAKVGMLFGGAKAADYTGNINLVVNGGTFNKVFGGNNQGGTITGNVTVTFNGGSADEVYGGCNESGNITGTIIVNVDSTNTTCSPTFYVKNVYGGGNLAAYDGNPAVNIKNGTVQQNVFGGGYGSTAIVTGTPVVTVGVSDANKKALVLGNVFGGGNAAGVIGSTDVNVISNSVVRGNIYGGGNAAPVSLDTEVELKERARIIGNIYGGGNQGPVGGNTKVIINGN